MAANDSNPFMPLEAERQGGDKQRNADNANTAANREGNEIPPGAYQPKEGEIPIEKHDPKEMEEKK